MPRMIFVNLPSSDIPRSRRFYEGLGFSINPQFSTDQALCVVVSETIYLMILSREFFSSFVTRPVGDPAATTQALISLSCDDRDGVDALTEAALAHGGTEPRPVQDMGFMYGRAFCHPDGNWFEPMWMDPSAVQ